ncbi:MAG: hypothetical protein KTR32_12615 [Granulosicoccus sp.]|nr:hypothetical protein [Granulosicoccus sp.]
MNDLKEQLAPGWSMANIVICVVLFFLSPLLALLMVGYIVWGNKLGLDLRQPQTFMVFAKRLTSAGRAAIDSFSNKQPKP